MKVTNILIVGVGGQGTILASNVVSYAAMNAGLDVKKSEIHGMSQRGGSVFSHVRFGKTVSSPVIPLGEVDVLISLEEMETARWLDYLNKDSKVIILTNRIFPANVTVYPEGIVSEISAKLTNTIAIDPKKYTEKLGNEKFLNIFLLGVLSKFIQIPDDCWNKAIKSLVPEGTFDKNLEAFNAGKNY